jgi:hypothetical protein
MNIRSIRHALLAALLVTLPAFAAKPTDAPPPLPKFDISTMLFLMLIDDARANSQDPIEVNGFDVDFGDDGSDDNETIAALDEMLAGK